MIWPQITIIALSAMALGIALVKHGEPKGLWSWPATLFGVALEAWLLYMGGFWSALGQ